MILYFTGTGNSKYIAEVLAQSCGDRILSINDCIKKGDYPDLSQEDRLIISTPVYAWRIPKVVSHWINKCKTAENQKIYFFINCGSEISNAPKYAEKLCCNKKLKYMGCAEIVMPENYVVMFTVPSEKDCRIQIKAGKRKLQKIAKYIETDEKLPDIKVKLIDRLKSSIVNECFYIFTVKSKKFYATENCVGCNLCEKLCPTNCISIVDGKPKWGRGCTHCMACISNCPAGAIEYGRVTKNKNKYLFSDRYID